MPGTKVWFTTGAAKGMGQSFVKAALADGHAVVATARRPDDIATTFGERDDQNCDRCFLGTGGPKLS